MSRKYRFVYRPAILSIVILTALALVLLTPNGNSATTAQDKATQGTPAPVNVGLHLNTAKAFPGYTLFTPLYSKHTYLIDMEGRVVKSWIAAHTPSCSVYLLPNGNLLRPCWLIDETKGITDRTGPAGGRMQEFNWDGEVVWDYKCSKDRQQHHDVLKLSNCNVLMLVWDNKTVQQCADAGRRDNAAIQTDSIIEVRPTG